MYKYILKRTLMLFPIIVGVTFLVFAIMNITPGDPGRMILGIKASQKAVDELNESFGINDPFFIRYLNYMQNLLCGDFGVSWRTGESVIKDIMTLLPVTLKLCLTATVVSVLVGVPLGVLSAVRQYSAADNVCRISAMVLSCIPSFWLSIMLMLVFSVKLKWLPAFGITSWKGWILPVVSTAAINLGQIIRLTRSTMLEVIRQDYITTARAKGVKESKIITVHALRNALIPVITSAGTSLGLLIGSSVFIENVFAIPGMGRHIVNAVYTKDIPVVMGSVIVLAIVFALINLLVDLMYALLDPRLKSMYTGRKKNEKHEEKQPDAPDRKTTVKK